MSEVGQNLEGQVLDGKFPLLRRLGGSDHSVAFLTERKLEPRQAAIKLLPAGNGDADAQISHWEAAAKLSHPNLIRLFETGRCRIGTEPYVYVVMEYAEENLYQILPDRPLSAEEAREMVPPVVEALGYLHRQGFVHAHVKPSNIVASGDQVKISADGVLPLDQAGGPAPVPSLYNPPEAASAGFSPAGDVWSLGVTLVEALTQHPPSRKENEKNADALPQSLPAPFAEIVRNCLRPRPDQRWSLAEVAATLQPPARSKPDVSPAPPLVAPRSAPSEAFAQPTFANRGLLVGSSLLVLAFLVFFAVKLWRGAPADRRSAPPPALAQPLAARPAAVVPPTTNQPAEKPSPAPVAVSSVPPASPSPSAPQKPDGSGAVAQQVLPSVPHSASNTIQGTIRVRVRVYVDPDGNVSSASLLSPGPSQYFAKLALQAAQKWKFSPARAGGQDVPSTWMLKFEFRRSGPRATASSAKP